MMRSLDQTRAAHAYRDIAIAEKSSREMTIKLPAMLQTNGLLATWVFLLAKKPAVADILLAHLRDFPDLEIPQNDAKNVFRRWVGGHPQSRDGVDGARLRALTAEALAFSVWLKRAAEAFEESPGRDQGGQNQGGGDDG